MKNAMAKEFAKAANFMNLEIVSLAKIGCSKDTQGNAYVCDVRLKSQGIKPNQFTGKKDFNDNTAKVRFVKTSDGWVPTK
jgi:hypothetical protein